VAKQNGRPASLALSAGSSVAYCLNLDSLDLRINMNVENDIAKSRKSFNQANQGSDNVAD
jgi:hypothetical protein